MLSGTRTGSAVISTTSASPTLQAASSPSAAVTTAPTRPADTTPTVRRAGLPMSLSLVPVLRGRYRTTRYLPWRRPHRVGLLRRRMRRRVTGLTDGVAVASSAAAAPAQEAAGRG